MSSQIQHEGVITANGTTSPIEHDGSQIHIGIQGDFAGGELALEYSRTSEGTFGTLKSLIGITEIEISGSQDSVYAGPLDLPRGFFRFRMADATGTPAIEWWTDHERFRTRP